MKNVLFVCLGNICRSPMAHGIFRDKVTKAGLNIMVESAGTSAFHIGEPSDQRAIETLRLKGIDIIDLRSRLFLESDFDDFDHIFTMDSQNQSDVLDMANRIGHPNIPKMIMDVKFPKEHISVPDPYYGGNSGFNTVFEMLDEALRQLAIDIS